MNRKFVKIRLLFGFVSIFFLAKITYGFSLSDLGPEKKSLKFGVVVDNQEYKIYRSNKNTI